MNFEGHIQDLATKSKSQAEHITGLTRKIDVYHETLRAIPCGTFKDPALRGIESLVKNVFRHAPYLVKSFQSAVK